MPDAETQFHAHEFMDATVQPKPIYISPNEIYTTHSLLLQHQDFLVSPFHPRERAKLIVMNRYPGFRI